MKLNSKMKLMQMPWHANMTEMNHLGAALIAKPGIMESKFTQLFTAERYSDNPLTSMLAGKNTKDINTSEWEWEIKGATTRPLVLVENVELAGNTTVGKGRLDFRIKLDENWYIPGDIIHPGNNDYQVRIQGQAFRHGNGYIYTVRLMNDDFNAYLPAKYLATGTQWTKMFSQYEEAAEQSGSTQYSTPTMLAGRLSRYRKQYRVTGDAAQEVLAVAIQGSDGKYYKSWIKYAEVEYWMQWYRELERGYWYSRKTDTVIGANGRPIRTGSGIQELLKDSHVHKYSHLTATLIEEYLMDIFYSRVKPGSGRKIKAFTGEYGMIQFHRAIQDWQQKTGFITVVDTNFIQKTDSPYNSNALSAGYQFTKYRMANGAELELVHNPLYDDRELHYEIDPVTGYPKESQRITFLDFSNSSEGNIKLVNKIDSFKLGYVSGMQTPYGVANKSMMSHSGDYYEMHVQKQCGVQIDDISRCGELILERN